MFIYVRVFLFINVLLGTIMFLKLERNRLTTGDTLGVITMLVRIVYYMNNALPKEKIVVTNDIKKAERIAMEEMAKLRARGYELEWVA